MLMLHRVPSDDPAALPAELRLLEAAVHGPQPVQSLFDGRRESPIRLDLVHEHRVSADLGGVQDIEEGGARRLRFVRDVRVPGNRAVPVGEERVQLALAVVPVHQMDLGVPLWLAGSRVDMVAAKVGAELERVRNRQVGEILVAKDHHSALRHKKCQLVLSGS